MICHIMSDFRNKVCILQSVNPLTRFIDYRSYYEVLPHKCIEVILIGEEIWIKIKNTSHL